MKKTALLTVGGLLLVLGGIVIFYLFLTGLNDGFNFLFFGLMLAMFSGATFCFIKANKQTAQSGDTISFSNGKGTSLLEKNNEMLGDYAKTSNARDRLKVLETAQENEVL